jgi:peptide/nickel transport system substrate-binding protein
MSGEYERERKERGGDRRSRCRLTRVVGLLCGLVLSLALGAYGCGSSTATTGTGAPGSTTTVAAVQRGGVLKVGTQSATQLDPQFATSQSDIMLSHQVYDFLAYADQNNQVVPDLATKWSSPDGKVWTFEIRQGVKFQNGSPMTVDDVVYSFNRLRDPKVGAPTVSLYANIASIAATDSSHVVFTLTNPNPEFPSDVADYHAAVLSKDVKDPKTQWVGTGPFTLGSYSAEDRAILKKNPSYWAMGTDGQSLPYLDEIDLIFSPDQGGQVAALQSGDLNYVPGLSAELATTVSGDSKLKLLKNLSNMHFVIHMRSDQGHVASDNRIRQALKLATDHQAMIDAVRPGLAIVGNDTPVGPLYKSYYLDQPPTTDLAKAKQLLAAAGYANGLKITLYAQNSGDVPSIATVWKDQMAKIGVTVDIQTIPSDVYYGGGDQDWLKVDFGITDWGPKPTPVNYFKVAYTTAGKYNESHWSDAEFDTLTAQIDSELDAAKRTELYKKAQQILIDRGPVIVPYIVQAAAGLSANLDGLVQASDWPQTKLDGAYFAK